MKREEIVEICEREVLNKAAKLFNTTKGNLNKFQDYEGAANLVYQYEVNGQPRILRLSFRPDRSVEQIQAELHFVEYLGNQGVRVSMPVASQNGILLELIQSEGIQFHIAAFIKGKGIRVPDNGYRYRDDAPIEEYFQNWGQMLGKMHCVTKGYQPLSSHIKRPEWFELHKNRLELTQQFPNELKVVRDRIQSTIQELKSLPKDRDSYGLIHGDFNDGNFTVNYSNGEITVFDFDDSCYFWFMYELASAWEGGIGRTMFKNLNDRKSFMDRYMDQVLEGYDRENVLSDDWLGRLPLFIRLIQMEELLHYIQYLGNPDQEMQSKIHYKIKCIEEQIPYLGFFDSIYSPQKPFSI